MNRVTIKNIMSWKPCEGYDRDIVTRLFKSVCGRRKYMKFADALKLDIPDDDKLWLVLRPEFISERRLHEIAIWCWEEIARPIWEKYYPDDKRPHEAVRIKRLWLNRKAAGEELIYAWEGTPAWEAAWEGTAAWAAAREAAGAAARKKIIQHIAQECCK